MVEANMAARLSDFVAESPQGVQTLPDMVGDGPGSAALRAWWEAHDLLRFLPFFTVTKNPARITFLPEGAMQDVTVGCEPLSYRYDIDRAAFKLGRDDSIRLPRLAAAGAWFASTMIEGAEDGEQKFMRGVMGSQSLSRLARNRLAFASEANRHELDEAIADTYNATHLLMTRADRNRLLVGMRQWNDWERVVSWIDGRPHYKGLPILVLDNIMMVRRPRDRVSYVASLGTESGVYGMTDGGPRYSKLGELSNGSGDMSEQVEMWTALASGHDRAITQIQWKSA